jgi:integrase
MGLTAKKVAKLLHRGEPGRHLDARGLYLIVQSCTAAHWEKRFQFDGREHFTGLGSARTFSLVEARERNRRASQLIADGVNPLAHKREEKAKRIAAAAKVISFGTCAEDYFRAHAPAWRHEKHIAQWRATVLGLTLAGKPAEGDYCKTLRPLPVATIDTPLILQVLRPLWHDRPETMSRVRARIASVLDYAKAAGFRSGDNPAGQNIVGKLLPARGKIAPVNHFEAVDYRAVPAFVAELRKREGTAARALEFLIYTVCRQTEVREAVWSEIDFDERLWTVPAERMKAGKEHKVPLSERALELLRGLYREGDSDNGLVFLGAQPGKPLSPPAMASVMKRMGHSAVPHGFRSSFSDWSHERTGHSNHAIELSLAHSIGAATEKAYRRGDMLEKRRRLMMDWARFCSSPPVALKAEGKVVVPMGRGRS